MEPVRAAIIEDFVTATASGSHGSLENYWILYEFAKHTLDAVS